MRGGFGEGIDEDDDDRIESPYITNVSGDMYSTSIIPPLGDSTAISGSKEMYHKNHASSH